MAVSGIRNEGCEMLKNNNLKICYLLALRDLGFHKMRTLFVILAVSLVTGMFTFVFLLGTSVEEAYLSAFRYSYGSTSHIICTGLTAQQARDISQDPGVKSTVQYTSVGFVSDEMMGSRHVELAVADEAYAQSVSSLPDRGRMPEHLSEIALDELTMDSLGILREEGYEFTLQWTDPYGKVHDNRFTLCGWWESSFNFTQACAWITPEQAEKLLPGYSADEAENVTLGVCLHQPDDLTGQAETLLQTHGIKETEFTINPGFHRVSREQARGKSMSFYTPAVLVLLCGFLMVFSILKVSVSRDTQYFAILKMTGMTPEQISRILLISAVFVSMAGMVPGFLLGFAVYYGMLPMIVTGFDGHPASYLLSWQPFVSAAVCTLVTVIPAYLIPAVRICRQTPAAVLTDDVPRSGRGGRNDTGRITLLRLASVSLKTGTGQTILSALSLLAAFVMICGSYISYVSYEEEIYLAAFCPWDYIISDGSVQISAQRYNEKNRGITEEMVDHLRAFPEVSAVSGLKSHEMELTASPELLEILTAYYNDIDEGEGVPRRQLMDWQPDWDPAFRKVEETGKYTAIVMGVEGAFLDYITKYEPLTHGSFDPEHFESGEYVLTAGAYDEELSTLPAGARVELNGRTFEVMAVAVGDPDILSGGNSPAAVFHLLYYVPLSVFDELFPGQAYRQLAVEMVPEKQETSGIIPDGREPETNRGIYVRSRKEYQERFENSRWNVIIVNLMIGSVMLMIGLLNFINAILTKMLGRRREFAMYESLGVTGGQLRKLLFMEGMIFVAQIVAFVVPATFLITWFGMPVIFSGMNTWCMVYRYTLAPLWIFLPVLILLAVAVPQAGLGLVRKGTITERLKFME